MTKSAASPNVVAGTVRAVALTAVFVSLAVGSYHWNAARLSDGEQRASDTAFIQMSEAALQREFQVAVGQLDQLVGSPSLKAFIESRTETEYEAVAASFLNFVRAARLIDQVLWLDSHGMEVVRVHANGGEPRLAPQGELQDKSGQEYFDRSLALETGHVFVSALDLEDDHGKAARPAKSTLRFATPVDSAAGLRQGVLVIDLMAGSLLGRISRLEGNRGLVHLLDAEGRWLMRPDGPSEPATSFPDQYPDAWAQVEATPAGQTQAAAGLVTFAEIHPLEDDHLATSRAVGTGTLDHTEAQYAWKLLTMVPAAEQHAALLHRLQLALLQGILLLGALTPGCWLFSVVRKKQLTARAALVLAERRLNSLMESAPDAILTLDELDKVVTWNRAANELFGLEGRDISGMPLSWLVRDPETTPDSCLTAEVHRAMRELLARNPNGEPFPIEIATGSWDEEERSFTCLIARDLTQRRAAEQQEVALRSELDQARKLEAIGQLAAGIAHEINTPTQFVGDNTRFLKESFDDIVGLLEATIGAVEELEQAENEGATQVGRRLRLALDEADIGFLQEEVPKALAQSISGLARVTKIVGAMKEFAHPGQEEKALTDLNRCIESTLTVATNEWRYCCELHLDLEATLPQVRCHAGEFNQAILNMVINASHAVKERSGERPESKGNLWVSSRRDGEWLEVRIRDDGAGIPEFVRARIFDPFFTTKEVGKGTGQGLAIAHDVITRKHGGSLEFETELGVGTCFIIRLPLAPPGAVEEEPQTRNREVQA